MDTQLTHQSDTGLLLLVENLISLSLSSSDEKQSSMYDAMLAQLVDAADSDDDIYFREMCAYHLYKLLTDDNSAYWNNNLDVSTQSEIKSILLVRVNHGEDSRYTMEMLCLTVSTLCNISNDWPELFHFLRECITSDSNILKQSFFLIFANLAPDRCQTLALDIMILYSLFRKTLNDDNLNLYMRVDALHAAINFIQSFSSLNELKRAQSLYPAMMRTLADALCEGEANTVLKYYIELAKNEPRFFRTHIVDAVNTMFEIAEDMNLEETTRHLALEFVLILVEAREKAPGMMKRLPLFTGNYFALLLNLLLDIKDEPSWHSAENNYDEAGETKNYILGRFCLERFSNALGGKTVAPIAVEQLSPYLAAPEWEKRHAALLALTFIAEGCSKALIKYLEQVMSMVLHSLQDPHPRVRWAAFRSISKLSIVFSPDLQERYHNEVVPVLAIAMDDFQNPRLQGLAIVAVMSYFSGSTDLETLVPYLDAILNKLLVLIQCENQTIQEEAIDALSAVAESSKEHFRKYYDSVIPHLKTILINANDKSNHLLRSKALGCISMVGVACGREKCRDDIKQVMGVLNSSQVLQVEEFDTICNILRALGRICICMGKDSIPYMSTIMPFLVKCAQLHHDYITDEINSSIHKFELGVDIIYTKRSYFLDVKSTSCNTLGLYALILEEDFYTWVPQVTSILIPLLKYYIDKDVRQSSCTALNSMLESAKLAAEKETAQEENESYFKQLSCDIIFALGDALFSEPDTNICAHILGALSICLPRVPLLTEDMLRTIMDAIKHVITESSHRKGELKDREKAEDFDAVEAELLGEEIVQEEIVCRQVGNVFFPLIVEIKDAFMPFYDELSSYLMPTRKGMDKTTEEKILCISTFHRLVVQCPEAAIKYREIYPFLLEWSNDENPKVREEALYGVGRCAEWGSSVFRPFVGEALPRIIEVMTHLHARELENEHAYENAVSALGSICLFHWECIDSAQKIIPAWLNCLPIRGDVFEAKSVHDLLCSMAESSDEELLGPTYEHFPKILSVFAEVLCAGEELATEETTNRMIIVLRNLQKAIPPATWASACLLLLPQHEMELEYVLSPQIDAN